jgi:hypothetical protein
MAIHGHLYVVDNPQTFFLPIVLGGPPPNEGYAPCDDPVTITMNVFYQFAEFQFDFPVFTVLNVNDGSFQLPFPFDILGGPTNVSITVNYLGYQYYRSAIFPYDVTLRTELDIWVYQPSLPSSDGITAGQVSQALNGHGLPQGTSLSVSQNGFSVSGSESQVSLQFGVWVTPDLSSNLNLYLDLSLNGYNINVGWPEDWCESPGDVLNSIQSGLQSADSAANSVVSSAILGILTGAPLNLSQQIATALVNSTSFQFVSLSYPVNYNWALSDTGNPTVVLTPNLAIGYPAFWS